MCLHSPSSPNWVTVCSPATSRTVFSVLPALSLTLAPATWSSYRRKTRRHLGNFSLHELKPILYFTNLKSNLSHQTNRLKEQWQKTACKFTSLTLSSTTVTFSKIPLPLSWVGSRMEMQYGVSSADIQSEDDQGCEVECEEDPLNWQSLVSRGVLASLTPQEIKRQEVINGELPTLHTWL